MATRPRQAEFDPNNPYVCTSVDKKAVEKSRNIVKQNFG